MSSASANLTLPMIAEAASQKLGPFAARITGVPYERKGILYSEMLFLSLCAARAQPKRILESGRARGQSTLLLAMCFPHLPIISIEHDRTSDDVAVAEGRLRQFSNVDLRFGDATRILPRIARAGDVVLIDGPKGFRAIRLALRLLSQGRVSMVFLHDMTRGSAERRFLHKHVAATLFSDDPEFAAVAHPLDASAVDMPKELRWTQPGDAHGYGLACLPTKSQASYRLAHMAAILTGFVARVGS